MTELEQKAADLEAAGWTVARPAFDDPYEVMIRQMMAIWYASDENDHHPEDDPRTPEYAYFDEPSKRALAFLKKHFVLRSEITPKEPS